MTTQERFQESLKAFTAIPSICFPADVESVDRNELTCVVTPVGGAELFDVRLKASVNTVTDGFVEIPVEGTTVLVCLIGNDASTAFVAKVDEVEEVVFYGGDNGGLTITPILKKELEKTNQLLEAIMSVINGAPINEWGNGAVSSFQAAMKIAIAGKSLGDFSEIENERVKH
jgi:hypothetical protein